MDIVGDGPSEMKNTKDIATGLVAVNTVNFESARRSRHIGDESEYESRIGASETATVLPLL